MQKYYISDFVLRCFERIYLEDGELEVTEEWRERAKNPMWGRQRKQLNLAVEKINCWKSKNKI